MENQVNEVISLPCVYLYASYTDILEPFTFEERGRLLTAMLDYAHNRQEPTFTGNERYIWPSIRQQLQRDIDTYTQRVRVGTLNGKKGGRPKKEATANTSPEEAIAENPEVLDTDFEKPKKTQGFISKPKITLDKEKDKDKDKDKDKEKEKDRESVYTAKPFTPPQLSEVQEYCRQQRLQVDPKRFVNYYTSVGWRIGSSPMQDWKAALQCWNEKEVEKNGKSPIEPGWVIGMHL